MTYLLRLIKDVEALTQADDRGELEVLADSPVPVFAIREFTPSAKDGLGLSLYEAADRSEALKIAAAMANTSSDMGKKAVVALAADWPSLQDAELVPTKTPGELNHSFADERHWELKISDHQSLVAVARIFVGGIIFSFEGREILNELKRAIRDDDLNFQRIAVGGPGGPAGKHLLRFIGERVAQVSGVPVAPASAPAS